MATGSSDPFSANLLKNVFSPKIVSATGGYQAQVDLQNVDSITLTGNVTLNGNGYSSGSVTANYLTLVDYAPTVQPEYLYTNNGELTYDTGVQQTNVLEWVPKLAQTSQMALLAPGADLVDVIASFNTLLTTIKNHGIILNTTPPSYTPRVFNVLAAGTVTPYTGTAVREQFLNVFNMTSGQWPALLQKVSQITSVNIKAYSGFYAPTNFLSDARIITAQPATIPTNQQTLYYAYKSRIPAVSPDTEAVGTTDLTITDGQIIKNMFPTTLDGDTIDKTLGIHCYWYAGYPSSKITNCTISQFQINYDA